MGGLDPPDLAKLLFRSYLSGSPAEMLFWVDLCYYYIILLP